VQKEVTLISKDAKGKVGNVTLIITLVNKKFVALMQTLVPTKFWGADFKSDFSFFL